MKVSIIDYKTLIIDYMLCVSVKLIIISLPYSQSLVHPKYEALPDSDA